MWQAFDHVTNDSGRVADLRLETERAPGGSIAGAVYACCAISAIVMPLVGVPTTWTRPDDNLEVVLGRLQLVRDDRNHSGANLACREPEPRCP